MINSLIRKFASLPMKTKLIIAAASIAAIGMASQQSNSHPGAFAPSGGYYSNWAPTPSPSPALPAIWPDPPSNAPMDDIINGY